MSTEASNDSLMQIESSVSGSHPLCNSPSFFEMYCFHPIDEPEVSVDVSGLFDSSAAQHQAASSNAASSAHLSGSTAERATEPPQKRDGSKILCRPVPIAPTPALADVVMATAIPSPTSRATSPSVVSSDEEGDDEEEDGAHGSYDPVPSHRSDEKDSECLTYGTENQLNASYWPGKRSVSALSVQESERVAEEEASDIDDEDDTSSSNPPSWKKPRTHNDAQRRARVLLWKQSLKMSLFHPQP
jgi:hypothetical protein